LRFLQIATGSLYELQTQLVIAKKLIIFFWAWVCKLGRKCTRNWTNDVFFH